MLCQQNAGKAKSFNFLGNRRFYQYGSLFQLYIIERQLGAVNFYMINLGRFHIIPEGTVEIPESVEILFAAAGGFSNIFSAGRTACAGWRPGGSSAASAGGSE